MEKIMIKSNKKTREKINNKKNKEQSWYKNQILKNKIKKTTYITTKRLMIKFNIIKYSKIFLNILQLVENIFHSKQKEIFSKNS
jgi:hypothetical protein